MSTRGRRFLGFGHVLERSRTINRQSLLSLLVIPALVLAMAAPSFAATTPASAPKKAPTAAAARPAELLDISARPPRNRLPRASRIGEAYAQKNVDGRPYKAKSELKARKIIPEAAYAKIVRLVVAKQAPALRGKVGEVSPG